MAMPKLMVNDHTCVHCTILTEIRYTYSEILTAHGGHFEFPTVAVCSVHFPEGNRSVFIYLMDTSSQPTQKPKAGNNGRETQEHEAIFLDFADKMIN